MQSIKTEAITEGEIEKVQQGSLKMSEAKAIGLAGALYGRGRFRQAEKVCRQILQHRPTHSDAHNILGVSLAAQGKSTEGLECIKRAIKLAPEIGSYHANLGEILRTEGKNTEALATLLEAIRIDPSNAQAFNNLGIAHFEAKNYEEAVLAYHNALKIKPEFPEAYNNLGNSLRMIGDVEGAFQAYDSALGYREVYPEAYNNLGTLLREEKKQDQAVHALKKAIQQDPHYIDAHVNLASLYFVENKDLDALRQMAEVLRFAPENAKSLALTARVQLKRGNNQAAEQACKLVLKKDPLNVEALVILGQLEHELDRFEDAIQLFEKALEIDPSNAGARSFYGVALKSVGRLDDAKVEILKALRQDDMLYSAYANLNDLVNFSEEKEVFDRIETIMKSTEDQDADRMLPMHYAYAKALDDVGKHEKALEHYILGGTIKAKQLNYVEEETFAFFERIKNAFSAEAFSNRPYDGNSTDKLIFIVGMPRSGSTLVEQIISSHRDVHGAGEVKYLTGAVNAIRDRFPNLSPYPGLISEMNASQFDIISNAYLEKISYGAGNAKKFTDKLLTNYFFIGLIHILFPNAKIVHTRRDPVDTCLSAFTKLFKDDMPHSYDLGNLGRYYKQYEALMDHWEKVLPKGVLKSVLYEDVVKDTELAAREVIDFVGLSWDAACLEFYKSNRPVKTASVAQVRKPIYNTSVARWKNYGTGLKPLIDALEG